MKKLWNKILATGTLGAAVLLAGCDSGETIYVPVPDPLFADYRGISDNNEFLALRDERNESFGDVLSFDAGNREAATLLPNTDNKELRIEAVIGNKVIVEEKAKEESGDIIICDLETLTKDLDTDTPLKDENLLTDNGKVVIDEYNVWTHRSQLAMYDPAANSLEDLFPSAIESWFFNKENDLVMVADNFGNEGVYSFDKSTGDVNLVLDSSIIPDFNFFLHGSNSDVVAYRTSNDIKFHKTIDSSEVAFNTNPNSWYEIRGLSLDQVILREQDTSEKNFHVDLNTGISQEIDFSSLGGWVPQFWSEVVVGSGKTIVCGGGNDLLADLLFYNPSTNTIEDLITASLDENESLEYTYLNYAHNGKALIDAEVNTGLGWDHRLLFFDGNDIVNPFVDYEWASVRDVSKDGRYIIVNAENPGNDKLVYFDLETQTQKIIASGGYAGRGRFSDDGTKYAFIVQDQIADESVLNVYDLATDDVQADLARSEEGGIDVRGFSRDNSQLIFDRNYNTGRTCMLDLDTSEEKFICYH